MMKNILENQKNYIQIMEQVDFPNGVKSHNPIITTPDRAKAKIGQIFDENQSWRIIEMREN